MLKSLFKVIFIVALTLTSVVSIAEDADALVSAKSLIAAGKYSEAYDLLEPLESERSGDVDFDYHFGVAAVESGKITRGIFALERVLAINPNHTAARSVIAKAYLKSGETDTAKAEFKNVLDQQPSKELANAIESYMAAIDKSLGLTTTFAAYIDFGIGHDSNINAATSSSSVAAPGIAPGIRFDLSNASQEQSSQFMYLAGGVSFRQPFGKNWSLFGSANSSNRMNWANDNFDTNALDFNLGLSYKKNIDTFTVALQSTEFDVDAESFRKSFGFLGQWQRDLDDRNQVSIFAQGAHLNYPNDDIRDADRYIIGAGWGHAFAGDKAPVLFLSAYAGREDTDDNNFDFLSNSIYGARAGGQMVLNYKLVAYASTSYEHRLYDGADPAFLIRRDDDQYDFTIGLRYLPIPKWTIKPQLSYIQNNSNIDLFEFDRTVLSVNFRRDFNW
ncbi:MAG TPA: surface lipoprotein assembly modifier [Methylophilaceae bacterium]|nr:surface lipoprotein assembly modifier [Methylophilaceae bacterium]